MKARTLVALLGLISTPSWACGDLTTANAWIRLAPPTAKVMAGYLTLANTSDKSLQVTGASSEDFDKVELHSMSMDGGVMQMRQLEQIEIKAGGEVSLSPGGNHLMLIGPKRGFKAGDEVQVALTVCDDQQKLVTFSVRESAPD